MKIVLGILGGLIGLGIAGALLVAVGIVLYSLLWVGPRAGLYMIGGRNLLQHRRRTFLLGGAIAGVTALLVILLGLSAGVRATMLRSATTLMSGHLNVAGFFKVTPGASAPLVSDYQKVIDAVKKAIPDEIDYVTHRGRGWAKLISDTGSTQCGLGGIDINAEPGFRKVIQLESGNLDDLAKPNSLMIFHSQAEKLGVKVGDAITISAPTIRGSNNTLDVTIVAIAKDLGLMSSFNVYVDAGAIRRLYQLNDSTTGAVMIYLKKYDSDTLARTMAKLRTALTDQGFNLMDYDPTAFFMKFDKVNREAWTGQKLEITKWEDEVSFVKWVESALNALIGVLTFILVVIIAVGIMNTLWIAIRERTREIGTLRAVGMQRRYVIATFVIEAFVLTACATVFGALVGWTACALLNAANIGIPIAVQLFLMSDTLSFAVETSGVLTSIGVIGVCTTLAAVIPSYLASRMQPITAMHRVG